MSRRSIRARHRAALSRPAAARYFTSFYFIYTQPAYLVDVVITLRRVVRRICRAAALIILVLLHPHAPLFQYYSGHLHTLASPSFQLGPRLKKYIYALDSRDFSSLFFGATGILAHAINYCQSLPSCEFYYFGIYSPRLNANLIAPHGMFHLKI